MSTDDDRSRYRLNEVMSGERVPDWLFAGETYDGVQLPGPEDLIRLYAPHGEVSAILKARLLTELRAPPD